MTTWPNWVDLIVLILVLTRGYNGLHRGALMELLRLTGVVVVTVLVVNYASVVESWLRPWLRINAAASTVLVFWGCFFLSMFIMNRLLGYASQAITWERSHWLTQGIGLVLGTLRGLWWSGLILLVLSSSGVTYLQESVEERSLVGPGLLAISRETLEQLSDRFPGGQNRGPILIPPVKRY